MNMMITELYDALIDAGAEEVKARDAARVLADLDLESRDQFSILREDNQAMRTEMAELRGGLREDMQRLRGEVTAGMQSLCGEMTTEMQSLRGEFKGDVASLRTELTTIKWMFGVLVGLGVAIGLRVFMS